MGIGMERRAKDGTYYRQVGADEWEPVTRRAKDGTVYKKVGKDEWEPLTSGGEESAPQSFFNDAQKKEIGTIVRNLNQGSTIGWSDEMAGVGEAAGRVVGVEGFGAKPVEEMSLAKGGPTFDMTKIREAYIRGRDAERARLAQDMKEMPGVATTSQVVGSFMSPINKVAPGASMTKQGVIVGATASAGTSEADNVTDFAKDTFFGAGVGGGIGFAAQKVMPYASKLLPKTNPFTKSAEFFAARNIGAERGTFRKFGKDKVKQAAKYALDNDIVGGTAEKQIAKNEQVLQKAGDAMEYVYSAVDNASGALFSPVKAVNAIEKKVGGFWRSPMNKDVTNLYDNLIESVAMRGEKITLKEASVLKQELKKAANFKKSPMNEVTPKEQLARDAYFIVSRQIDDIAESAAKRMGAKDLRSMLVKAKKDYSSGMVVDELLNNKFNREMGNKLIGLTDTVAGAGAFGASGDIFTTIAAVGGKKILERYGTQTAAQILDAIGGNIPVTQNVEKVLKKNPALIKNVIEFVDNNLLNRPLKAVAGEREDVADTSTLQLKGNARWALQGFSHIVNIGNADVLADPNITEKLFGTKKGQKILVSASIVKSEKALKQLEKQIEQLRYE